MKLIRLLIGLLFVMAWPVLLLSSTVTWAANDPGFYASGFEKYDIAAKTGIAPEDLAKVPEQFVDYFSSSDEYLAIKVTQNGQRVDLFNARELQHMKDVKDLVGFGNLMQRLSLIVVAGSIGLLWSKKRRPMVFKLVLAGCLATLGLIFVIGGVALINFDWFFLVFHLISFTNTLWILDPARDNLIRMFPEGFFFDSAMLIGVLVALEAALGSGFMLLMLRRSRQQ